VELGNELISIGVGVWDLEVDTPASTNGLLNHSFHQNCLSTLLHNGKVGYGSASGSILSRIPLPLRGLGLDGAFGLTGVVGKV
jgi:hypothetical protein